MSGYYNQIEQALLQAAALHEEYVELIAEKLAQPNKQMVHEALCRASISTRMRDTETVLAVHEFLVFYQEAAKGRAE